MRPHNNRSVGQRRAARSPPDGIPKAPTGIGGIDEVTGGGLPRGRPTLVCGTPGCGKTLFAMEFLVRGATQFDEPGVFVALISVRGSEGRARRHDDALGIFALQVPHQVAEPVHQPLAGFHASGRNAALAFQVLSNLAEGRLAVEGASFIATPPDGFCDAPLLQRSGSLLVMRRTPMPSAA
jgi:hypothetical protein